MRSTNTYISPSSYRAASQLPAKHLSPRRLMIAVAVLVVIGFGLIPLINPSPKSAAKAKPSSIITHAPVESAADLAQDKLLNGISMKGLNETQQKILTIAKQQFATHATSFDSTVLQYTEGNQESWCADFVSWIRNQAGDPYSNPDSGSWRIPGVGTLQAYYQTYGAYEDVGSYTPKLGDVAFYTNTTLSGDNDMHVALVLGVQGDNLITIGGNEGAGAGTIQVRSDPLQQDYLGLTGFGDSNLN